LLPLDDSPAAGSGGFSSALSLRQSIPGQIENCRGAGPAIAPISGARYNVAMRIIARRTLREFWEQHPDARQALQAWYADVKRADWKTPTEIKAIYRNASFLADNRVAFNVKGNQYRVIVVVQYQHGLVYIRFVGTHHAYDRIDAAHI
jgi:mRNA interferase HigB